LFVAIYFKMEKDFFDPREVLLHLDLKDDFIGADFGCGSGSWTIPLAKLVPKGKVFAIDLLPEPISVLRSKMKDEKIENIEPKIADVEENTFLPSEYLDFVLMTNLLFQVEDKRGVLLEAKRVLRKNGQVLIVDWKKECPFGPVEKVSKEKIKEIALDLGFKIKKEFDVGSYHFGMILVK